MRFIFFLILLVSSPSYCNETIIVDDFSSYKDTSDFLDTWESRVDGYKKTLKQNSYYYYLRPDPYEKGKNCLCSSLRMFPKGFVRKDIEPKDIKMTMDGGPIKAVSIYKDYWLKKIKIGKFHKEGKRVFLEWEWLANKLPVGALETKNNDDHAMAVYVALHLGWTNFRTIKYVWSSTSDLGPIPANVTKDKKKMVSIVSNSKTPLGKWIKVKVDLSKDIKKFLPNRYNDLSIAAVAVLSNSDNLKKPSEACVRNIKLVVLEEGQK